MPYSRIRTGARWCALLALTTSACLDDAPDTPPSEEAEECEAADIMAGERAVLAEFDATFDPLEGRWSFDAREAASPAALQTASAPLYCALRTSGVDAITLSADASSVGTTPEDCGLPNEEPYSALGTLCVDVTLTSGSDEALYGVFAEVVSVSPEAGYNGYRYPLGTGASPSLVPTGPNAPTDTNGGLWAYGDLAPAASAEARWVFENAGGVFRVSGRVVAIVPERRNGVDDNCDGSIDEPPYALGEDCSADDECHSGFCGEGLCQDEPESCPPDTWGPSCTPCDCDDGLFCNGEEICDETLGCQPGTPPAMSDPDACETYVCDEATDTLIPGTLEPGGSLHATRSKFAVLRPSGRVISWGDGGGLAPASAETGVVALFSNNLAFAALKDDGSVVAWGDASVASLPEGLSSGVTTIVASDEAFAAMKADGSVVTFGAIDAMPEDIDDDLSSGVVDVLPVGRSSFAAIKEDGQVVFTGSVWSAGSAADALPEVAEALSGGVIEFGANNPYIPEWDETAWSALAADGRVIKWADDGSWRVMHSGVVDLIGDFYGITDTGEVLYVGGSWDWLHQYFPDFYAPDWVDVTELLASGISQVIPNRSRYRNSAAFAAITSEGGLVSFGDASRGGVEASIRCDPSYEWRGLDDEDSLGIWLCEFDYYTGDSPLEEILATERAFAGLRADGSVETWGHYEKGGVPEALQVLLNPIDPYWSHHDRYRVETYARVGDALSAGVVALAATEGAFAARKEDGSVVSWGSARSGGLDAVVACDWVEVDEFYNDECTASSSVAPQLTEGVVDVIANERAFAAMKEDGSVVTWGYDVGGGDSSLVAGALSAPAGCEPGS